MQKEERRRFKKEAQLFPTGLFYSLLVCIGDGY
jgi:hypothetical protein